MEKELCETCLERGREREATHLELRMCDDCFNGKPFRCSETKGGGSSAAKKRWEAKHRKRHLAARRNWYRKHRDAIAAAKRERHTEFENG